VVVALLDTQVMGALVPAVAPMLAITVLVAAVLEVQDQLVVQAVAVALVFTPELVALVEPHQVTEVEADQTLRLLPTATQGKTMAGVLEVQTHLRAPALMAHKAQFESFGPATFAHSQIWLESN
jgi:hypothetical protein